MSERLKQFWEKGDFDYLIDVLGSIDPSELITSPIVIGIIVILVAMTLVKATSGLAKMIIFYAGPVAFLLATIVVLKNDNISDIGPFIMGLCAVFFLVGWFIWVKMLRD